MHSDILTKAVTRALADANISALVGTKVYNHVPKDTAPPYLRIQWGEVQVLPDKSDLFSEGQLTFDYWTDQDGDKEVLDMVDHITAAFHKIPLVLTEGSTNLLMLLDNYNTFLEGDGLSHHGIITFNLLIEE